MESWAGSNRFLAERGGENTANFGDFESYRKSVAPAIDARLHSLVNGGDLSPLYRYVVEGGKRLRPALTLLIAEALGGDGRMALDLGCSVELTHSASLALDDILDWHTERRGRLALHRLKGLRTAVTTGFTMPSLALNLAAQYGVAYPQILTDAWVAMCRGVYTEGGPGDRPWDEYARTVELKTARLYAAAATFGGLTADRREESFGAFGLHIGRAFQMADDLADGPGLSDAMRTRLVAGVEAQVERAARLPGQWPLAKRALLPLLQDAARAIVRQKAEEGM